VESFQWLPIGAALVIGLVEKVFLALGLPLALILKI
jgi:hypothetical protein